MSEVILWLVKKDTQAAELHAERFAGHVVLCVCIVTVEEWAFLRL